MSEEQAEYIVEAMQLLSGEPSVEIEAPRKVIERRAGEFKEIEKAAFIKISTSFKSELVKMSDQSLKVWIFISLSVNRTNGKAHPGLRTIARALGKGVNTIQECLKELEELGLLQVDRNSRKYNIYQPTAYVSATRQEPVSGLDTDNKTVSKNLESVSGKRQTVSDSQILNQRNQKEPEQAATPLSSETWYQFEKHAKDNSDKAWTGRELFQPDHYPLVDWYHRMTGQDCPMNKRKDWLKAVTLWAANNLTVADLQAAYDMDITWRGVFKSPNELTDKAIAIKAQKKAKAEQQRPVRNEPTALERAIEREKTAVPMPADLPRPNFHKGVQS